MVVYVSFSFCCITIILYHYSETRKSSTSLPAFLQRLKMNCPSRYSHICSQYSNSFDTSKTKLAITETYLYTAIKLIQKLYCGYHFTHWKSNLMEWLQPQSQAVAILYNYSTVSIKNTKRANIRVYASIEVVYIVHFLTRLMRNGHRLKDYYILSRQPLKKLTIASHSYCGTAELKFDVVNDI